MKLPAAFGALSSNSSTSMSPSSVAMVARVMTGSFRLASTGSWVADRDLGHGDRVGRLLLAARRGVDGVDRVHARRDRADDLVRVVLGEDRLVLVVEDGEALRS